MDSTILCMVADLLLSGTKLWNEPPIREIFYKIDAEDILRIKNGEWEGEDIVSWNWTLNGLFTVRSAYHANKMEDLFVNADKRGVNSSVFEAYR